MATSSGTEARWCQGAPSYPSPPHTSSRRTPTGGRRVLSTGYSGAATTAEQPGIALCVWRHSGAKGGSLPQPLVHNHTMEASGKHSSLCKLSSTPPYSKYSRPPTSYRWLHPPGRYLPWLHRGCRGFTADTGNEKIAPRRRSPAALFIPEVLLQPEAARCLNVQ